MIISFIVYPFYSLIKSVRDIFKVPKPFVNFNAMDDHFYVVSYFLDFSRILPSFLGILSGIAIYLLVNKYFQGLQEPYKIAISFVTFIAIFWIISIISYLIQSLIYISNTVKRISAKLGEISSRKFSDEDSTKLIH